MKKTEMKILLLLCLPFFTVSCNNTNNWPGWRGEHRDAKVDGFKAPSEWPEKLTILWQEEAGLANSSPILMGDEIFLHVKRNNNEVAVCVNANTGEEVWETILNPSPEVTGGPRNHPGPRSTPLVEDGNLYTLGVGGILHCLDAKTGDVIWKVDRYTEVPEFYAAMSPIVIDNMCVAHLGGQDNGVVAAFDAESGETIWTIENEPATYSSPVTMNVGSEKILVVQTGADLLGISYDGDELWRIPTPTERRFYNSSTPVIDGQNVIVAGQGVGTKSFTIEKSGDEYSYQLNWENPNYGVSFNSPVLKDGYLYGNGARLGKLFCLDASTGETAWADTTAHNRFAALLDLGSVMVTLPATGNLIFFEPNPEEYSEIKVYKVSETEVYAHPVFAGNKIYIKDEEMLTCYSLGN